MIAYESTPQTMVVLLCKAIASYTKCAMLCILCLLLVWPESTARKLHLHLLAFYHSAFVSQTVPGSAASDTCHGNHTRSQLACTRGCRGFLCIMTNDKCL